MIGIFGGHYVIAEPRLIVQNLFGRHQILSALLVVYCNYLRVGLIVGDL